MSQTNTKRLVMKRDFFLSRLLAFKQHFNDLRMYGFGDEQLFELEERIVILEKLKHDFYEIQQQIELGTGIDYLRQEFDVRTNFENTYVSIVSTVKSYLASYRKKK